MVHLVVECPLVCVKNLLKAQQHAREKWNKKIAFHASFFCCLYANSCLIYLKFKYCEKTTKFEKKLHLFFELLSNVKKTFKIFLASQNIWTLRSRSLKTIDFNLINAYIIFLLFIRKLCSIYLQFKYCEKATKFVKKSHLFLKLLTNVKIKWEIFFSNFLAFSEYLNFTYFAKKNYKFQYK